jgi:leader peptidase (prepilin peptidase)/N-methyltransferase
LPALLVWALTLIAAATCDAMTQRIPTPILRTGGLSAAALGVLAGLVTRDWRALAIAAVACCAAGLILGIC